MVKCCRCFAHIVLPKIFNFCTSKDYQGKGIGKMIMDKMQEKYSSFHMQMLTADGDTTEFYKKMGFSRASHTEPMWIYKGSEH